MVRPMHTIASRTGGVDPRRGPSERRRIHPAKQISSAVSKTAGMTVENERVVLIPSMRYSRRARRPSRAGPEQDSDVGGVSLKSGSRRQNQRTRKPVADRQPCPLHAHSFILRNLVAKNARFLIPYLGGSGGRSTSGFSGWRLDTPFPCR